MGKFLFGEIIRRNEYVIIKEDRTLRTDGRIHGRRVNFVGSSGRAV